MATYVGMVKVAESEDAVEYAFGPGDAGLLRLAKDTGEVTVITEVPGDERRTNSILASRKAYVHWRDGEGYPEKTCWAS